MDTNAIIEEIHAEIRRLEQAKTLLNGAVPANHIQPAKQGKRIMSAEAREKIAAAQRRRWARTKRAAKYGAGSSRNPSTLRARLMPTTLYLLARCFAMKRNSDRQNRLGTIPSRSAGGHGGGARLDLVRPPLSLVGA
jgi:hypothetical protein